MTTAVVAVLLALAAAPSSATASAVPEAGSELESTTTATVEDSLNREARNIADLNDPHVGDGDDPDFSGIMDFSNAIPGPDGSWCITKTKYIDHMVKDQIKECWHQNITQCHDTYITEFLPSQERKIS